MCAGELPARQTRQPIKKAIMVTLNRRSFCLSALSLPLTASAARLGVAGSLFRPATIWDAPHESRFVLEDLLEHPFYWWPRTLLSYRIEFRIPADLDRFVLTQPDTREEIPIQFSAVE